MDSNCRSPFADRVAFSQRRSGPGGRSGSSRIDFGKLARGASSEWDTYALGNPVAHCLWKEDDKSIAVRHSHLGQRLSIHRVAFEWLDHRGCEPARFVYDQTGDA